MLLTITSAINRPFNSGIEHAEAITV